MLYFVQRAGETLLAHRACANEVKAIGVHVGPPEASELIFEGFMSTVVRIVKMSH